MNYIENIIKKAHNKTVMRRIIAMLSVVVLFVTVNHVKFIADTLERLPACGLEEHIHDESCYDAEGVLTCGLDEHVHTDACFQQRPAYDELPVEDDLPEAGGDVATEAVEPDAKEAEWAEMADDEAELNEPGAEAPAEETEAVEEPAPGYVVGSQYPFYLSDVIRAQGLDLSIDEVEGIGQVIEHSDDPALFRYERVEGDYALYVLADFARAEMVVTTNDDVIVVELLYGIAPMADAPQAEETVGELPVDEAEVPAEADATMEVDSFDETGDGVEAVPVDEVEVYEEAAETELPVEEIVDLAGTDLPGEEVVEEPEAETADNIDEAVAIEADEDAELPVGESEPIEENIEEQPVEDAESTEEESVEEAELTEEEPVEEAELTEEEQADEAERIEEAVGEETAKETEQAGEAIEEEQSAETEQAEEPVGDEQAEEVVEDEQADQTKDSPEAEKVDEAEDASEEEKADEAGDVSEEEQADQTEDASEEGQSEEGQPKEDADAEGTHEAPEDEDAEKALDAEETDTEGDAAEDADPEDSDAEDSDAEDAEAEDAEAEETDEQADVPALTVAHYAATIDLAGIEVYPISLNELMAQAVAEDAPAVDVEETPVIEEEASIIEEEEPLEAEPDVSSDVEWIIDYDPALLAIEPSEGDYMLSFVADFEETVVTIDTGDIFTLTLRNGSATEAEPEPVPTVAHYAATIDLAGVEVYPISLNELMAQAVAEDAPAIDVEETPIIEEDEAPTVEEEMEPVEEAVELDAAWIIDYEPALLAIEPLEGDYALSVVADFEETVVTINTGDIYTLTLRNGSAPEPYPAQAFAASTDYVNVAVSADAGAFPAGTVMAVKDVEDADTLTGIADKVEEGFVKVERVHAVDISFYSPEGDEIEPLIPISVTMTVREIEQDKQAVVVHVDSAGEAQLVEDASEGAAPLVTSAAEDVAQPAEDAAEALPAEAISAEPGTALEFTADAFSVYAVVVGEKLDTKVIDADGNAYRIELTYNEAAGIPAGATLEVSEVTGDDAYLAQAEAALPGGRMITRARFFDIKIMKDGAEVQPAADVQVKVWLEDEDAEQTAEADDHTIVTSDPMPVALHFVENEDETVVVEKTVEASDEAVVFSADGFSVWGFVYTVDFYYGNYEYHLDGEGEILLSRLFELLEIDRGVADVRDVSFTNEELLKVEKVAFEEGQDWLLTSLMPFDTTETLTVAFTDGMTLVIDVTDAQISTNVLTHDGQSYTITVTYDDDANIPEGTELYAEEILPGTQEYEDCMDRARDALQTEIAEDEAVNVEDNADPMVIPVVANVSSEIRFARFFDIKFIYEGLEIEPEAPVQVTIEYTDPVMISDVETPMVVHFANTGTEVITPNASLSADKAAFDEPVDGERQVDTFTFEQESFSVTGSVTVEQTFYGGLPAIGQSADFVIASKGSVNNVTKWRILSGAENKQDNNATYCHQGDGYTSLPTVLYMNTTGGDGSGIGYNIDDDLIWTIYHGEGDYYTIKSKGKEKYLSFDTSSNTKDLTVGLSNSEVRMKIVSTDGLSSWAITTNDGTFFLGLNNGKMSYNNTVQYPIYVSKYFYDSNKQQEKTKNNFSIFKVVNASSGDVVHHDYPHVDLKEEKVSLAQWKKALDEAVPISDYSKTAEVYDYDNRIYQIDITASSGMIALDQSIDLAFITDVSNSMLFSSKLEAVKGTNGQQLNYRYSVSNGTKVDNSNGGRWFESSYYETAFQDKSKKYILIGDPNSESCQYVVWYDSDGEFNAQGQWVYMDASYYAKWQYYKTSGDSSDNGSGSNAGNWWKMARYPRSITGASLPVDKFAPDTDYPVYLPTEEWIDGLKDIYSKGTNFNAANRLYYIKKNVKDVIEKLYEIASNSNLGIEDEADKVHLRVALETFCKDIPTTSGFGFTELTGSAQETINTLMNDVTDITTFDGTDQRGALEAFNNNVYGRNYAKDWSRDDGKQKFVIVISDGAPNVKGTAENTTENVREQVNALMDKGATVISVGLSLNDVEYGKQIMTAIASDQTCSYKAEDASDLTDIIYHILQKIIGKASVGGMVQDTIDKVFYPVDRQGNPLPDGTYINLTGDVIAKPVGDGSYVSASGQSIVPWEGIDNTSNIGKLTYNAAADNWTVTWAGEVFNWPEGSNPGWHGTVYVKTKEDFLGGNTINTNDGKASINPYYYSLNGKWHLLPEAKQTPVKLETPYVNIDELKLTQEESEWTVYLGETVDPLKELETFYGDIDVLEVVTATRETSGDHIHMTDVNAMLYPLANNGETGKQDNRDTVAGKTPETFKLSWAIEHHTNEGQLTEADWQTLLNGQTVIRHYSEYGHAAGVIQLNLDSQVKPGETGIGAYSAEKSNGGHATTLADEKVEVYTLTAKYIPNDPDSSKELHTGSYWSSHPGNATNEMQSVNNHVINVFVKSLQIIKKDEAFDKTLSGAKFALYRTARSGETGATLNGVSGSYHQVAELDCGNNGMAYKQFTSSDKLGKNETYYLVETKAPDGYNLLTQPIPVLFTITDTFKLVPSGDSANTKPESSAYNWIQTAVLCFDTENISGIRRVNEQGTDLSNTGVEASSSIETLYYYIANNPGYILPSTGGPGTLLYTLAGGSLILLAVGLLLRRKKEY